MSLFTKKEIALQPLNGDNLRIFSLDRLDQDEVTIIIFLCISVNMLIYKKKQCYFTLFDCIYLLLGLSHINRISIFAH